MTKLLHPRLLGLFLIFLFASQTNFAQQEEVIHCWNFNSPSGVTGDQYPSPVNVANRTVGTGTITHDFEPATTQVFGGSILNACSGSSAGQAFVVRGDASLANNNKRLFFNFSSEGFEDLIFSFWSQRTGTGFNSNTIEYSTDGSSFTPFPITPTYTPSLSPGSILNYDLSSVTNINDQTGLVIRITFAGASNAGGNNRIDNVTLEGNPINDDDSVVLAGSPQVPSTTIIAADVTTTLQSEPVLNFDIQDLSTSDALSTEVDQMRFVPGPDNTANWSTTLQDVIVRDNAGTEISGTSVITDTEVIFTPDSAVEILAGETSSFSADVVLSTTGDVIDQSIIEFQVEGDNSGFTADPSGSLFSSSFADIIGNEITIDVFSTSIAFLQEPTDVARSVAMQPAVEVAFVDVNGNTDTEKTEAVSISSTGDLVDDPILVNAVSGVATFSYLVHSLSDINLVLTATTSDPFSATSAFFDVISNDITSEVIAPGSQVGSSTITAANSTLTPTPVFNFNISDLGSGDVLPTEVNQMRFVGGASNTADWSTTFDQFVVKDNSGTPISGSVSTQPNEIIFSPDAPVSVGDGDSDSFSVEVTLNTTGIIDQSVIQFQVNGTDSGFEAEFTGSTFNSPFPSGDVVGENITIDIVASEFAFVQQPTDVEVNAFINPAVQVGYVDENGNIDTSVTTAVSLTSSGGILVNDPIPDAAPVNGIATFSNIGYSAEALGLILTANTTESIAPTTLESAPFNVGIPVIAVQDFDRTQPEWLYDTSVPPFGSGWDTNFFGEINSADATPLASGSFVNNIFGENDLNSPNGTTDFASLDFVPVDITGYTDVELSFDWEVSGYNVSGDRIEYEVFFDGVSQGRVLLYEGGVTTPDLNTETIPVDPGTNEVSFQYFIQNDGQDGYSGLDNVKLTGDSNARDTDIIEPIAGQVPAGTLIADVNDDLATAVDVFGFEVVDSGNFDNLPTNITRLRFVPGSTNNADWATALQGISISDGTDILDQANQTVTITTDEIIVDITSDPDDLFVVSDGTSRDYILSVFLNTTGIIDQEVIQLAIADGNEDQLASNDGSIFSQGITAFEGSEFLIEVIGTQLEFFVQPTTTFVDVSMSPSVRVRNLDANDNVDLDNTVSIVISSEGTLNGGLVSRNISSSLGYANFNTLQHTATGFDLRLTASTTSGSTSIQSLEFNIILESTLLISEVIDPSDDADGRYVELFNMDVEPIDLDDLNYFLINPSGTGESIQLTGVIPPKSYYVISFIDDATFNSIYGRDADFVAPTTLASDGNDIYQLSFDVSEPRAILDVYGDAVETGWEFTGQRAYRNIPSVRVSNSTYTSSEWTLESSTSSAATIGVGDNDYVYSNDTDTWGSVGIGTPTGGLISESIFVEDGTATLSASTIISDVVVRDGATLIIEDAIKLNGDFANFGKVTFRSTATETAVLGEFDGLNRKLVGNNYEIERFIPQSNRAFRYIAPSVTTASSPKSTIRANWQEGVNNTETIVNGEDPNNLLGFGLGYGTHITGNTSGANGFDATLTGNPSMFEWSASNQQWNAVPNTDTKVFNVGEAYAILIRGDRSTTLNSNTAVGPATTLRTTGRLAVGSRGVDNVGSNVGDFSLIGNPYQARINLTEFMNGSSGVSSQFVYIYDPTLGTRGGYATVDLATGDNTSETTPETSSATNILEPNQAFFVETTLASQAVVYSESYKAINTLDGSTQVGGNVAFSIQEPFTNLYVNLYYDNIDTKAVDAVKVKFRAGANNAKDTLDATKVWNYDESFAIDRNPNYMSIETRSLPTAQDSVPFYLGNFTKTAYRLEIKPENFTGAKAYLFDRYLETSTELPSEATTAISFEIDNSIPASKATDRFVIKFEEVSLSDDDFELNSSLSVYPNPLKGSRFSISHQQAFSGKDLSLKLFDLQGRLIVDQTIENAANVEVDLNKELASGVYILNLSDGKASQSVKLMVK